VTSMDAFIDVGKSGSRLHVVERGTVRVYDGRGASPTQPGNSGLVVARQITEMLLAAEATSARHILIGSTVDFADDERRILLSRVRRIAPDALLGVTDDGTLAHARHLHQPGVLLAVGTGVIAVALSPEGGLTRFDGWGPLAGDRGSAVDVGRTALREAFRDVDESRTSPLRARVETALGTAGLELGASILSHENWPAVLSSLAQLVCDLADDDDEQAGRMLDSAADELVRTARVAVSAATAARVAVTGRFGGAAAMRSRLNARFNLAGVSVVEALPPTAIVASEILSGPYSAAIAMEGGR
jgi:glucosamine kinase